jgi:hypothetical protein
MGLIEPPLVCSTDELEAAVTCVNCSQPVASDAVAPSFDENYTCACRSLQHLQSCNWTYVGVELG